MLPGMLALMADVIGQRGEGEGVPLPVAAQHLQQCRQLFPGADAGRAAVLVP